MAISLLDNMSENEQGVVRIVEDELFSDKNRGARTIRVPVRGVPSFRILDHLSANYSVMKRGIYYDSSSGEIKLTHTER